MPNKIGMSSATWADCFSCTTPYTCTNTSQSSLQTSLGDQMFQYRSTHIATLASNVNATCEYMPGLPFSYASPTAKRNLQSISCNYTASELYVTLEFDGKSIGLTSVPLIPIVEIVTINGTWLPNVTIITMARNIGYGVGNFSISIQQCCFYSSTTMAGCYTSKDGGLSYRNSPDWLTAGSTEEFTFHTTALAPSSGFSAFQMNIVRSIVCDLHIQEAENLTSTDFVYAIDDNLTGMLGAQETDQLQQNISIFPVAISFVIQFMSDHAIEGANIIKARFFTFISSFQPCFVSMSPLTTPKIYPPTL